MTDVQLLFVVLGVIYLWECALWASRASFNIRTWLGRKWSVATPSAWLGNQRGMVVFGHPLPPLGTLFSSNSWPVSVSPKAVLAYVPPSVNPFRRLLQTCLFFRFEDIRSIQASGKKVWINDQLLLKVASPTLASCIAAHLQELRQAKITERGRLIEKHIERTLDTKTVEKLCEEFRRASAAVRVLANVLFAYLFVFAPLITWKLGFSGNWLWLLGGTLGCTISITILFHRAHKHLYPEAEDERFTHSIIVLLSPASAVRAHDLLARPLLEAMHPLAAVRLLCSDEVFRNLAQDFLRELRYPAMPLCPRPERLARETEEFARGLSLRTLEGFLRHNKLNSDSLLQPPTAKEPSSQSFCPRCHAQFTARTGTCQDCGGVALVGFSNSEAQEQSSKAVVSR